MIIVFVCNFSIFLKFLLLEKKQKKLFFFELRPVRLELTTLRLWDLRAADCAMVACVVGYFFDYFLCLFPVFRWSHKSFFFAKLKHSNELFSFEHFLHLSPSFCATARKSDIFKGLIFDWTKHNQFGSERLVDYKFCLFFFLDFWYFIILKKQRKKFHLICDLWGSNSRP